jgi:protein TonB
LTDIRQLTTENTIRGFTVDRSFQKSILLSALTHALLIFLLFELYKTFLVVRTPLLMEMTLIGRMSQGAGLGAQAAQPGEAPSQLPSANLTAPSVANPEQEAPHPALPLSEKPEVSLRKRLTEPKKTGRVPSRAYLEKLRKEAPIGLVPRKNVTNQIKTTGGLGHTGVAGTPEGNPDIEGELAGRALKRQVNPAYPDWARKEGIEAIVRFRLSVLPNGLLKESDLQLEQTSGYRELDRIVYEALIQWEFNPLPSDLPQVDQTGIITFSFNLK